MINYDDRYLLTMPNTGIKVLRIGHRPKRRAYMKDYIKSIQRTNPYNKKGWLERAETMLYVVGYVLVSMVFALAIYGYVN